VACHCLDQSDADTFKSVPECTTAEKIQASLKHDNDTDQEISRLL